MPSDDTPCNRDNQDGFRIAVSTLSKWGMQINPGKFEVFLPLRENQISPQKMAMPKSHWYIANSLPLTLFTKRYSSTCILLDPTISSSSNFGRTCALSFSHSAKAFADVSFSAFSCACEIWCFVCLCFPGNPRENTAKHHNIPHVTSYTELMSIRSIYPSRHTSTGIPLSCNSALCSSCLTVAAASSAAASRFDKDKLVLPWENNIKFNPFVSASNHTSSSCRVDGHVIYFWNKLKLLWR